MFLLASQVAVIAKAQLVVSADNAKSQVSVSVLSPPNSVTLLSTKTVVATPLPLLITHLISQAFASSASLHFLLADIVQWKDITS